MNDHLHSTSQNQQQQLLDFIHTFTWRGKNVINTYV